MRIEDTFVEIVTGRVFGQGVRWSIEYEAMQTEGEDLKGMQTEEPKSMPSASTFR